MHWWTSQISLHVILVVWTVNVSMLCDYTIRMNDYPGGDSQTMNLRDTMDVPSRGRGGKWRPNITTTLSLKTSIWPVRPCSRCRSDMIMQQVLRPLWVPPNPSTMSWIWTTGCFNTSGHFFDRFRDLRFNQFDYFTVKEWINIYGMYYWKRL